MTFRRMDEATVEQWYEIDRFERIAGPRTVDRVIRLLESLSSITDGFSVDRLTHCLQTAARAEAAGVDREWVVAALCHDTGMAISGHNHAPIAAEILRPYVRSDIVEVVRTHDDFQGRYYYELFGGNPDARLKYQDARWFSLAERFSDEWDQVSFDPDYPTPPLSHFEPAIRMIFTEPLGERQAKEDQIEGTNPDLAQADNQAVH